MNSFPCLSARSALWIGLLFGGVFALANVSGVQAQQVPPEPKMTETTARMTPVIQAATPRVQRAVERAFHGPDGEGKDGPMAAVGRNLIALHQQHEARGPEGVNRLMGRALAEKSGQTPKETGYSPVSADGRFVTVNAVADERPKALLDALRRIGMQSGATAGNVVSGRLPIAQIEAAAGLASLRGMQAAHARTHGMRAAAVADSVIISEADTAHSAVSGRASLGVDGSGEKICALSDSYDSLGDASTNVSNGELPGSGNPHGNTAPVDVLDDLPSESDEGRAMLQLIHDIAPGAELGFDSAFLGLGDFAQGIRDLADAGCTVIVDDIGYSVEPFYQDGPVANAVDDVVENDDVAYFSSAGNDGQNSYEASFRNSGTAGVINSSSVRHDFDGSSSTDTEQQITVDAGGTFQVWTLQWSDPSALVSSTGADTDLDVALVDATQDTIVAQDADDNDVDSNGNGIPVEGPIEYTNGTGSAVTLNLVIEKAAGPDPDEVKYVYKGSGFTIDDQYGDVGAATVYGHPMAAGAEAVAAAPFYYTDAYRNDNELPWLESFSSKGGIQIRFDQNGNELNTYETRNKPDVTGTDGNDNTFFGSNIDDGDSHPNFFGTSAAAPNVAAIAALVREANPGYGPTDVYDHLEMNAKDVTRRVNENNQLEPVASGEDPWSGHGFVQATSAALPVELADFEAAVRDSRAVLRWTTASETNNAGFTVEHRRGDGPFRDLGFVESKTNGTATEATSYRYRTSSLRVGTHTFRLRQEDLDGSTTQSRTVTVEVTLSGSHRVSTVSPNPVQQTGTATVTVGTAQQVRAAVYNALGQRVTVLYDGLLPADDPTVLRMGEELQNGVYLLRVEGETFSTTQKFVRVQ